IRTMYKLVLASPDDAEQINGLCERIRYVADAFIESECRVPTVRFVGADFAGKIFPALATTDEWGANDYIPLVFYQVWLKFDASKKGDFLAALDKFATCALA